MEFSVMQDAVLDQRFGETRRDTVKRVINAQIAKIWSAYPWGFKRRPPVSITVATDDADGLYAVTASEVIEEFLGCYDEDGDPLTPLSNDKFEELYEGETESGTPQAFTIYGSDANMKIRFGPAPDENKTYTLPYNAGPPTLSADTNDLATYGWPAHYHEVIVVAARIQMLRDENDPTWRELEPERKQLLDSMIDALVEDRGGETGDYGADTLGYEVVV